MQYWMRHGIPAKERRGFIRGSLTDILLVVIKKMYPGLLVTGARNEL